jgi:hypothetical protein
MSNAKTVLDLERQRVQATVTQDVEKLNAILADDLIYTHSSARLDNKASFISAMLSGATVYKTMDVEEIEARDFGDTVVLTGTAQLAISANGKPINFGVRFTNVYAKRDGDWQMAVWQSTKTPA